MLKLHWILTLSSIPRAVSEFWFEFGSIGSTFSKVHLNGQLLTQNKNANLDLTFVDGSPSESLWLGIHSRVYWQDSAQSGGSRSKEYMWQPQREARIHFNHHFSFFSPRFSIFGLWVRRRGSGRGDNPSFCHLNYGRITGFHFTTANLSPCKSSAVWERRAAFRASTVG